MDKQLLIDCLAYMNKCTSIPNDEYGALTKRITDALAQPAAQGEAVYEYHPGDSIKKIAEEMVSAWTAVRQGDGEFTLEVVDDWAHRIMCFADYVRPSVQLPQSFVDRVTSDDGPDALVVPPPQPLVDSAFVQAVNEFREQEPMKAAEYRVAAALLWIGNRAEELARSAHPNCGACAGDGSVCEGECRVEGESPPFRHGIDKALAERAHAAMDFGEAIDPNAPHNGWRNRNV